MWRVHVLLGGQDAGIYTVEPGHELVVGRDPTADVVVGERSVSRRHCRLTGTDEGVEVVDLGSANGVFLDGRQIQKTLLRGGQQVQVGMAHIRVGRAPAKTGLVPIMDVLDSVRPPTTDPTTSGAGFDSTRSVLDASKAAYKSLERERLALLIEAGKSLGSSLEVDDVLERIMDHLFQILPVSRAVVALQQPDGTLRARHVRPEVHARELSRFCSQGIIRQCIETGRAQIIEDASLAQDLDVNHSILASNIKAAICAPLVSQTRTVGALYADYPGKPKLYTLSDLEFFGAFASLAAISLENARMQSELRERMRIQRDLEIAGEIQKGLLPDDGVEISGIEIDWAYLPSRHVGGDFYDCTQLDDQRLALILGDVSGKGMGAALFMARLMSFFRATVPTDPAPGRVLTTTNALLGRGSEQAMFATACYLLVSPGAGTLRYASAGHNPGLILPPNASEFVELKSTGIPLGILPNYEYVGHEVDVVPGSLIVLFTDGVTEARHKNGTLFGLEALKRLLLRHRAQRPQEIIREIRAAVEDHCDASTYIRDDIALLVARLSPPESA